MKKVHLPTNALEVLIYRYSLRDEQGRPVETPEQIFARVARVVAETENQYIDGMRGETVRDKFYQMLLDLRFMPNGRTIANAGAGFGQLANCYVLPIEDEMGKTQEGIFSTLKHAALILQAGGGVGFSFGRIRPKGDRISTSKGKTTGAVSFIKIYDRAFDIIGQGGGRRSACMAILPVNHPDIWEFIHCKEQEGEITNFNISVGITDEFMRAVQQNGDFDLVNPHDGKVWEKVKARKLFDELIRFAHHNGEPGVVFLDTANRDNPVPHLYRLEATNPCFAGNTRVPTQWGLLKIEELVKSGAPLELTADRRTRGESRGVEVLPASPAYLTRKNEKVFELVTHRGYRVAATADHRFFMVDRSYKKLGDIKIGDEVCLQSGEGLWSQEYVLPNKELFEFRHSPLYATSGGSVITKMEQRYPDLPVEWSKELGMLLGWLVGDGWLTDKSKGSPLGAAFGKDEGGIEGLELIRQLVSKWFTRGCLSERPRGYQLTFGRTTAEFFRSLGLRSVKASEKSVPESIFSAPREAVTGFLQGLFSADGTVQISLEKQYCSVRLASTSKRLLEEVQLLLLNFGIVGGINRRRKVGIHWLPDAKGEPAKYRTAGFYELIIGKASRNMFAEKIGFALSAKQDKLEKFIGLQDRGPYRESFVDKVVSITYKGREDVYDITQSISSSLIAQGLVAHNCAEQALGPYENCCLASINLAQHVDGKNRIDWEKLGETARWVTRFLDDVVDANKYVPTVTQLEEAAKKNRRIGVSIMGLADMMYRLGVRYGAREGQDLAGQVMEFIAYQVMGESVELACERGAFPGLPGSIYDRNNFSWKPKQSLVEPQLSLGRPKLDWSRVVAGIKKYGIRNAAQMTIAPTGAIATISGLEGYGCEPVFALSYVMRTHEGAADGKDWHELYYESKLFAEALKRAGLTEKKRKKIFEQVRLTGSCQGIAEVPEEIRRVFVTAGDVTGLEHVGMQAALQRFVDNSISKTINLPATASVEDVEQVYFKAWELGCKGMTVYVTGSRETVVLETGNKQQVTSDKKQLNGEFVGVPLYKVKPEEVDTCPECGSKLRFEEGCATCPNCAYSHCSV